MFHGEAYEFPERIIVYRSLGGARLIELHCCNVHYVFVLFHGPRLLVRNQTWNATLQYCLLRRGARANRCAAAT
jgi:hypothetical protein